MEHYFVAELKITAKQKSIIEDKTYDKPKVKGETRLVSYLGCDVCSRVKRLLAEGMLKHEGRKHNP